MEDKINIDDDNECPLCLDTLNDTNIYKTSCNHVFHLECIKTQFNSCCISRYDCPSCRANLLNTTPAYLLSDGFNTRTTKLAKQINEERILDHWEDTDFRANEKNDDTTEESSTNWFKNIRVKPNSFRICSFFCFRR
tara:strand:- start:813 stop:1223 length:411 start_codon:yes stop_codon:yes gene_type:complete